MMRRVISCLIVLLLMLYCLPLGEWYFRSTGAVSPHGYYEYNGYLFESQEELSREDTAHFVKTLQMLKREQFTKQNRVFYAIIPEKSYFIRNEGYPVYDYERTRQIVGKGLPDWQEIFIAGELELSDYYKTDNHWKQEELLPVAGLLAEGMQVTFPGQEYRAVHQEGFRGMYAVKSGWHREETLTWLESEGTGQAAVYHKVPEKKTALYVVEALETASPYDIFLGGAAPILTVTKGMVPEKQPPGRELIVFGDSFASSLVPLLLPAYAQITVVDLRFVLPSVLPQYVEFTDQDILFLYSNSIVNSARLFR